MVSEPDGKRFSTRIGSNLLDALRDAGPSLSAECGGKGTCGKCLLVIKDQKNVSKVGETERALLTQEQLDYGYRLACQTILLGDITVYIPRNRTGERRIQETGVELMAELDPSVRRYVLTLSAPHLGSVVSDADNLIQALKSQCGVDVDSVRYSVMKLLPETLRQAHWQIQTTVWNREVIAVGQDEKQEPFYGLAVDIGTSKLVVQLIELGSGTTVNVESMENPQIIHGEDIYTRMAYTLEGTEKRDELARLVIQGINTLISETCTKTGTERARIYEMTVVGNTAMHHLFLRLPTRNLALSPFVPVVGKGINILSRDLRVNINPEGNIYMFPVIAGFVGGDAVADILATGIHDSEALSLLVDIGTNTEICLGNKQGLISCSCASGPAFEGYHITHGVKAVSGAIERIRITPSTLRVEYETVNGTKPIGICGSGMVDALAEMRRNKIVTPDGRFSSEHRDTLGDYHGGPAFMIAQAKETLTGEAITITQKDIRELQLAKAAILTGCEALLKEKKVGADEVETVYVAGAFGNYLNIQNAIAIGMLPRIPVGRFRMVGNTAVVGAKLALLSLGKRSQAEKIANETEYLELGARPTFNQEFTAALAFPEIQES